MDDNSSDKKTKAATAGKPCLRIRLSPSALIAGPFCAAWGLQASVRAQ